MTTAVSRFQSRIKYMRIRQSVDNSVPPSPKISSQDYLGKETLPPFSKSNLTHNLVPSVSPSSPRLTVASQPVQAVEQDRGLESLKKLINPSDLKHINHYLKKVGADDLILKTGILDYNSIEILNKIENKINENEVIKDKKTKNKHEVKVIIKNYKCDLLKMFKIYFKNKLMKDSCYFRLMPKLDIKDLGSNSSSESIAHFISGSPQLNASEKSYISDWSESEIKYIICKNGENQYALLLLRKNFNIIIPIQDGIIFKKDIETLRHEDKNDYNIHISTKKFKEIITKNGGHEYQDAFKEKEYFETQNKQSAFKNFMTKAFSYCVVAPFTLLVNGGCAFIGLMNLLLFIPLVTSPIAIAISGVMAFFNCIIFYCFDLNVIKKGMGIHSISAVHKCLKFDENEVKDTDTILPLMQTIATHMEVSDSEVSKYNYLRIQLNESMLDKKAFFKLEVKVSAFKKWTVKALTLAGLCMSGAGAYFGASLVVASIGLGPLGWVVVGCGILALMVLYHKMQVQGIFKAFNPTAARYKKVKDKVNEFIMNHRPIINTFTQNEEKGETNEENNKLVGLLIEKDEVSQARIAALEGKDKVWQARIAALEAENNALRANHHGA